MASDTCKLYFIGGGHTNFIHHEMEKRSQMTITFLNAIMRFLRVFFFTILFFLDLSAKERETRHLRQDES